MGRRSQRKGYRVERGFVVLHEAAGIDCERVPLSGAAGGSYSGDLVVAGRFKAEVKARAAGAGFKVLERWLGDNDLLFLRRNRSKPLVVMDWDVYLELMGRRSEDSEKFSEDVRILSQHKKTTQEAQS